MNTKGMTRYLDNDGYPTEEALKKIREWNYADFTGWMEFIKSIWNYVDWGWYETEEPDWIDSSRTNHVYRISTAGWSGNENIIRAMQQNTFLWAIGCESWRRGGHYVFIPCIHQRCEL